MELLRVSKLNKRYRVNGEEMIALNNVDFELNKGEILAIMGSSGSGERVHF